MNLRFRIAVLLPLLLLGTILSAGSKWGALSATADGPCNSIGGDPTAPIGPGEPGIVGTLTNANTQAGISGATVQLYLCSGATAVHVTNTTTNSSGHYAFNNLSSPAWYFVQVPMTGPLSGMSVSSGTQNPSAAIDIGDGATVNFAFE